MAITFLVDVPRSTSADATVYLAGNLEAMRNWDPAGLPLRVRKDGRRELVLLVPSGTSLEFKFTLGTWERVEKGKNGEEIGNRRWVASADQTLELRVESWASSVASRKKSTRVGLIRDHENFESRFLHNKRRISVYLPPGYESGTRMQYPVMYIQDGQNLFDEAESASGTEWEVDETAERLIGTGRLEPMIIVGVHQTRDRVSEYTASADPNYPGGGNARTYARFLVEELMPFINDTYRTRTEGDCTGIAGSSLGALACLEIVRLYPEKFGRVGLISPSLWWNQDEALESLDNDASWLANKRVWVDMECPADPEPSQRKHVERAAKLADILTKSGLKPGRDLSFRKYTGDHHESTWASHFDQVLLFLYPKSDE